MRTLRRRWPGRAPRLFAMGLACASACASACTPGGPRGELTKQLDAGVSSAAAAQLTLERWLANSVPTAYATRTLDAQRAHLEDGARAVARLRPDPLAPGAESALRRAAAACEARDAIARHDTAAVRARDTELAASADALRALLARAKAGAS